MAESSIKQKFRSFLLRLSKDIKSSELDDLKFLFYDFIPDAEAEQITTGLQLMNALIKKGVITEENLGELIDSLKDVGRDDLARRCDVYQEIKVSTRSTSAPPISCHNAPIQVQSPMTHPSDTVQISHSNGHVTPTNVLQTFQQRMPAQGQEFSPDQDMEEHPLTETKTSCSTSGKESQNNVVSQASPPMQAVKPYQNQQGNLKKSDNDPKDDLKPCSSAVLENLGIHSTVQQNKTTPGDMIGISVQDLSPSSPDRTNAQTIRKLPVRSPITPPGFGPRFITPVAGKPLNVLHPESQTISKITVPISAQKPSTDGDLSLDPDDTEMKYQEGINNSTPQINGAENRTLSDNPSISLHGPVTLDSKQDTSGTPSPAEVRSLLEKHGNNLSDENGSVELPFGSGALESTKYDVLKPPSIRPVIDDETNNESWDKENQPIPSYNSLFDHHSNIEMDGPMATVEEPGDRSTIDNQDETEVKEVESLRPSHIGPTRDASTMGIMSPRPLLYSLPGMEDLGPDVRQRVSSSQRYTCNGNLTVNNQTKNPLGMKDIAKMLHNNVPSIPNSEDSSQLSQSEASTQDSSSHQSLNVSHEGPSTQEQIYEALPVPQGTSETAREAINDPVLSIPNPRRDIDTASTTSADTFVFSVDLVSNPDDVNGGASNTRDEGLARDINRMNLRPREEANRVGGWFGENDRQRQRFINNGPSDDDRLSLQSRRETEQRPQHVPKPQPMQASGWMGENDRRRLEKQRDAMALLDVISDDENDDDTTFTETVPYDHQVGEKTLRRYQLELAEVGLSGTNCIICAPTGSGKTMTAGYICRERRRMAKDLGRRHKTLFIVCIRNLIKQQAEALRELFPDDSNIVGDIGDTELLKDHIQAHDVVVLTAQILVNCLRAGEVDISTIDLLIMDECHHTNLDHAYNNIMRHIHEKRFNPLDHDPLPQIIGLTASLGVGKDEDNTIEHYIKMCANLDCTQITHIRNEENKKELLEHNPKPTQDQIKAVPNRRDDTFIHIIRMLIRGIERLTRFYVNSNSPATGSQAYTNWVVKEQQEAEAMDTPQAADTVDSCEALKALSVALEYYDDLTGTDVLKSLDEHFAEWQLPTNPTPHKERIFTLYQDKKQELENAVDAEDVQDQPKLQALQDLLLRLFEVKEDPRVILLTRTIFSTVVLVNFVQENLTLGRAGVKTDRLVGKGDKKNCMTDAQQEDVLKRFRDGDINLLIATDVAQEGLDIPRCNLLIRYNFVSNEIGQVQAKGRARAKQSECYLILNKGSLNERRELSNLQREHKMLEALDEIDLENPANLTAKIERKKRQLYEDYQMKKNSKKDRGRDVLPQNVTIVCKKCKTELGKGNDIIRKGEGQYINTSLGFENKVIVRRGAEKKFRYDTHIGSIVCSNAHCEQALGIKMKYQYGARREGYSMSCKGIMMKIRNSPNHDENTYYSIKQWSKVPFHSNLIEEPLAAI